MLLVAACGCNPPEARFEHPSLDPKSAIVPPAKVYPVTPKMASDAAERVGTPAPEFALKDQSGKSWTLASVIEKGPALLYFINHDCPCCSTAQPFVERLSKAFAAHVPTYGVINADKEIAARWSKDNAPSYPLLLDPKQEVIQGFGVHAGVYMVLVGKDGMILRVFPGYSAKSLPALASAMAKAASIEPPKLDWSDAPSEETSGCAF